MKLRAPVVGATWFALGVLLDCSSRTSALNAAVPDADAAVCFDACFEQTFAGSMAANMYPTYLEPPTAQEGRQAGAARTVEVWPCGACDSVRCGDAPTLLSSDVTVVDVNAAFYSSPTTTDAGPVFVLGKNVRSAEPQTHLSVRELAPVAETTIGVGTMIRAHWVIHRGCHGPVAFVGTHTEPATVDDGHVLVTTLAFGVPGEAMGQPGFCGACVTVEGNLASLDGKRSWRVAAAGRLSCAVDD